MRALVPGWCAGVMLAAAVAGSAPVSGAVPGVPAEVNPVRPPIVPGPQAGRLIVAFRSAADGAVVPLVRADARRHRTLSQQAGTTAGDVASLAARAHLALATSRQLTPSVHVMYLQRRLAGADVDAALRALRADPAVRYADVDRRRFPHAVPDDPLFAASASASGQWYMMTPSMATPTSDAAATDAVSAWSITTGSTGTVIADVDTGVRFDHPDLLRAGFGGRLLPGYDFVNGDASSAGTSLGTYLTANDGDGWDPDPSDPGDWIDASDQTNALFPAKDCPVSDSSWHGTRVMGILGAVTNNAAGIAGMTWNPYLLPVRALGKCGGYDSDIIAGMQWAAGLTVTGVPDNPYPADIINLSLGAAGACPSAYADAIQTLAGMGVLVVVSAGNGSEPPATAGVEAPGNCPGVLTVAGLRNVGTKVGYSSLGPEVRVSAPAGNCVNTSGACLRSIDTTSNAGLTSPAANTYTDQVNPNLGTSFSAPIVAGIAALMRSVNANLTPSQLIQRIQQGSVAFPQPVGLPVCPNTDPTSGECACPRDGSQCGAGMANALGAVEQALRPVAAVSVPAGTATGTASVLDATGSAPACGRTIAGYAWTAAGGVAIQTGTATAAKATVTPQGTAGTVTLTVTDSQGATDTVILAVSANGAITAPAGTPITAGSAADACPVALAVSVAAPTVTAAFLPASVTQNAMSTLTLTLGNTNAFALTGSSLTQALPAGLTLPASGTASAATTTCTGGGSTLTSTANGITLSGADIPAQGSCQITVPVQSATAGDYTDSIAAAALTTGPAGANKEAASATLTVTAPAKSGGGALDGWDCLFAVGVILAGRRGLRRPMRQPSQPALRAPSRPAMRPPHRRT